MGVPDDEKSLAVRAAWLHYAGGLRQSEVAQRMGITGVKAHRLIAKANQMGAVKVIIQGEIVSCLELERSLCGQYGFDNAIVVPNLGNDEHPIKELAVAGANYLRQIIMAGQTQLIGVGHGRTLRAMVSELPEERFESVQFVSLLGGLTRNYAANPHDVIHKLAEKTWSQSFVMPVPLYANTTDDVKILMSQQGVSEVLHLGDTSPIKIVGIGAVNSEFGMRRAGIISDEELTEVRSKGAEGEMLGSFFDAQGALLETELSQRTISVDITTCRTTQVVAIAGGHEKVGAIRSVAKSGLISCLITDETSATELIAYE